MKRTLLLLLLLPALLSAQNLRRWGGTGVTNSMHGNWLYNAHPAFTLADSLKLIDFRLLRDTADALRSAIVSGGGALRTNIHVVTDADYTVSATDYFIIYSNITTARTLTLPAASANENRMLIIKHGGSGATAITLSISIRENLSTTGSSIPQNKSYGLISDGTDWWVAWIN